MAIPILFKKLFLGRLDWKMKMQKNSLYQISDYTPFHCTRNGWHESGSVALFVYNSVNCKEQPMLARTMISLELCLLKLLIKTKNYIVFGMYRAPHNDGKVFKNESKSLIKTDLLSEKQFFVDWWYQYRFTSLWI